MKLEDFARQKATSWLSIFLEDEEDIRDLLWSNLLYEEPDWEEFWTLLGNVLQALLTNSSLPPMEEDVRKAIAQYLENRERIMVVSELENRRDETANDEELDEIVTAITHAYFAFYQRLQTKE